MTDCPISDILNNKMKKDELVRIQTVSGSTHEGKLSSTDCLGVLFVPTDPAFDPAYILFTDIRKFMLPEHQFKNTGR
jgi:hypothetical protein